MSCSNATHQMPAKQTSQKNPGPNPCRGAGRAVNLTTRGSAWLTGGGGGGAVAPSGVAHLKSARAPQNCCCVLSAHIQSANARKINLHRIRLWRGGTNAVTPVCSVLLAPENVANTMTERERQHTACRVACIETTPPPLYAAHERMDRHWPVHLQPENGTIYLSLKRYVVLRTRFIRKWAGNYTTTMCMVRHVVYRICLCERAPICNKCCGLSLCVSLSVCECCSTFEMPVWSWLVFAVVSGGARIVLLWCHEFDLTSRNICCEWTVARRAV